jgi:signal peptidase I
VTPTQSSTAPQSPESGSKKGSRRYKLLILIFVIAPGVLVGALAILRVAGLLRAFNLPTGGMEPAVARGDHVIMEGVSYLARPPRRGDIIVFRTDHLPMVGSSQFYAKRLIGEPGERLRIVEGKLYINDEPVSILNAAGEIKLDSPPGARLPETDLTVPADSYFVVGDNATNSFDSRMFGCVPRSDIIGRVAVRYYPYSRMGSVR